MNGPNPQYLFVRLSSKYYTYVTTRGAVITVIVVRIFMVITTLVIARLDPDILKCSEEELPICSYLRKNNFLWVTIPMFLTYVPILLVTLYVSKVIVKSQRSVAPAHNLPSSNLEPSGGLEAQNNSPELEVEDIEMENTSNVKRNHNSDQVDVDAGTERTIVKIKRSPTDPHTFFREESENVPCSIDLFIDKKYTVSPT